MRTLNIQEFVPLTGKECLKAFLGQGFADFCRRNVVGYSLLFCSVRGVLSFKLFYNDDDPPAVPECDDVAFTLPLGGWIRKSYVLERNGSGWKRLPWAVGAGAVSDPTNPKLTVCRVENGRLIARFDNLSPSAALATIRGIALQEIGSRIDVFA